MSRKDWDEYFIDLAVLVASRSSCLRKQHGAVIVKDKQILSTGYNGTPAKVEHCKTCFREDNNIPHGTMYELCKSVHAEMNSIILAAKYGISVDGADMYITGLPCLMCTRVIINAGIKNVIVLTTDVESDYASPSLELLKEAKIPVRRI